jgi:hypothetical protein
VWHAHGTLADAPEASRSWLAEHLATHHAAVDPGELVFFGWHLHFELPTADGEPSEQPSASVRLPVVINTSPVCDTAVQTRGGLPGTLDISALPCRFDLVRRAVTASSLRRGYFHDDGGALSLPLRLRVARC